MESEQPPVDDDQLKRDIADAMRKVIREIAAERGMTYDDYLDSFAKERPGQRRAD
jgi:hypothetical protein